MVISLILIWSLLKDSKKSLSGRILAAIFLALFFMTAQNYGDLNQVRFIYAIGFIFSDPIGFVVGPLLYLYIQSLCQNGKGLLSKYRWHFLPLVIYVLLVTIPFFLSIWLNGNIFGYLDFLLKHYYLLHFQALYLLFYAALSLQLVSKYKKIIKENYSNFIDKNLNWIRYLLIAIVLLMCINFASLFYELLFDENNLYISYITTFSMILAILYLGYYGSSQAQIFLPTHLIEKADQPKNKVYSHSLASASTNEVQQLKQSLEQILQEEKPYLNEELTLGTLAKMLPTTDKKLSALLNHELNTNFYDLINHYRVEAVKNKMGDSSFEHYTLLAIAFECGFKSKTSFNRIFKKETGLSPSAYKKQFVDLNT